MKSLRQKRQLERLDLIVDIEQGRRVELALYEENHPGIRSLTEIFEQRQFTQRANVLRWNKRVAASCGLRSPCIECDDFALVAEHGIWCPCDDCNAAVKRLLRAAGVLPRGRKESA